MSDGFVVNPAMYGSWARSRMAAKSAPSAKSLTRRSRSAVIGSSSLGTRAAPTENHVPRPPAGRALRAGGRAAVGLADEDGAMAHRSDSHFISLARKAGCET